MGKADMKKSRIAGTLLACLLCLTMQVELVEAQANSATKSARLERIKKQLNESSKDPNRVSKSALKTRGELRVSSAK